MRPTARGGLIIGWCGMRGIVSLAAALALPAGFPERDLVQFCAFVVVLGTLLIQGLTLAPLIRLLNMPQDTQIDIETAIAKKAALRAGLASLQREDSKYAVALRIEFEAALGGKDLNGADALTPSGHDRLRVRSIAASREAIAELFREGQIGKDAYLRVQAALTAPNSTLRAIRPKPRVTNRRSNAIGNALVRLPFGQTGKSQVIPINAHKDFARPLVLRLFDADQRLRGALMPPLCVFEIVRHARPLALMLRHSNQRAGRLFQRRHKRENSKQIRQTNSRHHREARNAPWRSRRHP